MPIYPVDNEAELLEKVAEGDEKAFASLFYGYHNQLAEFVLALTGSNELTEEIIQDVFLKVWEMRVSLTSVEQFTGWLFILSRNYTLNGIRKMNADFKKRSEYEKHMFFSNVSAEFENNIPSEYFDLVKRAIEQLPGQQRRVFSLRHEEGLSYAEIAEVMNISKESVKKYLQIAFKAVCNFIKSNISSSSQLFLLLSFLYN